MMSLKLDHFDPEEFGEWWPLMCEDWLLKLDRFRDRWGAPVLVSKAIGALGRHAGDALTMHNVDRWYVVRAGDIFPKVPDGSGGFRFMCSEGERRRAYIIAKEVGFTGIGIYTDTNPGNMLHVDNRAGRLATWSRVKGEYLGISEVLA